MNDKWIFSIIYNITSRLKDQCGRPHLKFNLNIDAIDVGIDFTKYMSRFFFVSVTTFNNLYR